VSEDQNMCQKKWPKVEVRDCMHDAGVVLVAI
jgi:hypothetical protein